MSAIIKSALSKSIMNGVYSEFISKTGVYYYFLGKTRPWANGDTPEDPVDTFKYEMEARNRIIAVKQISVSDLSYVVRRIDWVSGTVYDMYDDNITASNPSATGAIHIEDANFYVITDEFNVYKCIDNNNGAASTEKPIGSDSVTQTYDDGYLWKFMFNIPVSLRNKFLTTTFMPVTIALNNRFYSNGEVTNLSIDNGGSGYTTASISISGDGYLEENPRKLTGITITDAGEGYASAPAITISAPTVTIGSEIQATASCTVSSGEIATATLTEDGYGYEEDVTLSTAAPFSGVAFATTTAYTNGQYVHHLGNYYLVVGSGTSGSINPTHTSGSETSGSISLTYAGRQAVLTLDTVKTEAHVSAVVSGGEVVGYIINDAGIGYTVANATVTGDGTGAEMTVNLSVGDIDTLQANVELQATPGSIEAIQVVSGGGAYSNATVIIEGDGTGAAATVTIVAGIITKVTMTNVGSGYTYANITITGSGSGATARAVMSPLGGHGKNAISELYTKTLMFFSSIFNEKNLGFTASNDYRQSGIIKQLNKYGDTTKFRSAKGSACFKIAGVIDVVKFPKDAVVYQSNNNKQFIVVESTPTEILLQSLDNAVPETGLQYRNISMDVFTAGVVTVPTIDKFSGEMLYLENRSKFESTSAQAVTFRTIIGF